MDYKVITGDSLQVLKTLPEESIQCCVTSPPYWGLRDYGTAKWEGGSEECDHKPNIRPRAERPNISNAGIGKGDYLGQAPIFQDVCGKCGATRIDKQLGLELTPEEYVSKMVEIFREVRRVLRKDGTLWLNLGDSYCGGGRNQGNSIDNTNHVQLSNISSMQAGKSKIPSGLKPKDLVGIPWRVAFALQADGWYLRQDIIWAKPNPMPESVTDRCTKAHEYIFLLTKSGKYYYDNEAVSEDSLTAGKIGGFTGYQAIAANVKPTGNQIKEIGQSYIRGEKRNRRSVWTVTTKPYKDAHFATFPPDLIEPCILAGSSSKCCAECGKPYKSIFTKTKSFESGSGKSGNEIKGKQDLTASDNNSTPDIRKGPVIFSEFVEMQKDCDCITNDTKPSTILDPFAGSGTTLAVATKHNRNSIGIELNPEYVKLIHKRVLAVPLSMDFDTL